MTDYVQARWFTPGPRRNPVRKVVIHDMEALEGPDTAERCAAYFANHPGVDSRGNPSFPSAHVCADNNSRVRCVHDSDIAHHAPGANHDGLGLELAGFARQTRAEWLDPYGQDLISQAAHQVAEWCSTHDLPARFVQAAEMAADPYAKGVTTHWEVTKAYRQSTHTDPGPNFPMDVLLERVRALLEPAPFTPPTQEADRMYLVRNTETQGIHVVAERTGVGPNVGGMEVVEELERTGVVTKAPNGERWADLSAAAFGALPSA